MSKRKEQFAANSAKRKKNLITNIDRMLSDVGRLSSFRFEDFSTNHRELSQGVLGTVREDIEQKGVAVVRNAIDHAEFERSKLDIGRALVNTFRWNLDDSTIKELESGNLNSINAVLNCKDLGLGNAGFGFIFKHLCQEYPTIQLDANETVDLDINFVYHDVILELLERNPLLAALILGLTHGRIDENPSNKPTMISHDSIKFASNPRPKPKIMTQQNLTPPHFDKYSVSEAEIDRYQAMIVVEDQVKLGFVPGTHLPEIQTAIAEQLGNTKLYASSGFKRVDSDTDLLEIFNKHWISAPKYSLVIWRSGLVHYEASAREYFSTHGLHHFESLKNTPNQLRIRYVVGVHRVPSTTSQETLRKMAILASRGLSHAPYSIHNKKLSCYGKNIVNSKNTLYKKSRNVSGDELEYMQSCLNFKPEDIDNVSKFKQFLMGCRGDFYLEDIFTDVKCLNLLN